MSFDFCDGTLARGIGIPIAAGHRLFVGQELMLVQLWYQDHQSQQCLGRMLRLDHSTVAKSVRRLEEAGGFGDSQPLG